MGVEKGGSASVELKGNAQQRLAILIKLVQKKMTQRAHLWKRRLQCNRGLLTVAYPTVPSTGSLLTRDNEPVLQVEGGRRQSFYFDAAGAEELVRVIHVHYCKSVELSIDEAVEACGHVFDVLGSGKLYVGDKIDWHRDFKSGYRWPLKFYADVVQVRSDKFADVKVPRELSRCHHFVALGKAYWYTRDEKYAREFASQLKDWLSKNPPWMSINWCSAMDVAIRLVNWIWAYHFFIYSPHFTAESKNALRKGLCTHAEFVYENLEYFGEFSDNHYLSNVVGLAIVGTLFPEFSQASKWRRIGLKETSNEIISQVHEDGAHFEGSISYHRLVLEMFASALILFLKNDVEVSKIVWSRLEKMFEFVLYYTKPDGTAPQIGDTDNGRLHVLGHSAIMDHRYLLAIGAALFERPDFKAAAGSFHEEAFWLLGEQGLKRFHSTEDANTALPSKAFRDGGFYFMRNAELYMAVRCAANGRRGIGNHSHNDALSFELYAYGKTFIIDPGTFVYTPDPASRNLFRSTAYHNTLVVDGEEINRLPDDLFQLMNDASPVVNQWETTENADLLDAQHNGYERLREPVTHRRQFYFDKAENYWFIRDLVTGEGKHDLSWYFHFNSGIDLSIRDESTVETLCHEGPNLLLRAQDGPPMSLQMEEGWVSPSYGIKNRAQIARYSCTAQLPVSVTFILYPYLGPSGSFAVPAGATARAENRWCAQ